MQSTIFRSIYKIIFHKLYIKHESGDAQSMHFNVYPWFAKLKQGMKHLDDDLISLFSTYNLEFFSKNLCILDVND